MIIQSDTVVDTHVLPINVYSRDVTIPLCAEHRNVYSTAVIKSYFHFIFRK